ncbi:MULTISPECIES: ABC transporter ATP-binding protein [unclassified Sphingobacterium]|uniref:ABC transporter ATP-binding protein n=1 Tax=unclassified Sphingobacterium TaxID=2609468 RepID=UPI00105049EC|nr:MULTISPECIES: ABC transporter ATP-binding protein [unclassified Sphingobacterium]MCS3556559.1 ABC-2 type transport system ATP-binding protein [Sphingobacterium sp. JUb21]TCQ99855.1 ABC-2 type transport system ATP-binding protein [Sphingobacterium sp. JUb20]
MILKVEQLSHRYGSSWAVRDLNLEISGAGIIGLLGSNGAGKSTTMNIICGVLNPTKGKILINGIDLSKDPVAAKRNIGFLPQTLPLYTDLTVDEYLIYTAQLRLVAKDKVKKAVEEVKERCGIAHMSSRLIRNLSGGYRQRVGIAQAIIHKPRLVVMDEPTNGLDPNQIIEVRKLIRELGQEHTVLLSSHVLSEINLLCRDVIMIESGQIVFSDSMRAFNNYASSSAILLLMENPPAEQELLNIPGVRMVENLADDRFRLEFEGGDDVIERVMSAGLAGGWCIREIGFDKSSLDDIFNKLSHIN